MNHDQAVQQKATERYLLDELDPEERDQFEEHLFDCQDCALDVRAAAMFVEQSKAALSESPTPAVVRVPVPAPQPAWFRWCRPALVMPVLALLLLAFGYQNLVTVPHLMQAASVPQVGPWVSVNVGTRGPATAEVTTKPGEGFSVVVNLLPDSAFASYTADLYNPAQKLEWSGQIATAPAQDARQIYIPGRDRQPGIYTLVVQGVTPAGERKELSRHPIDLKIQK
jgi:anti-sigma factor RsiW